MDGNLLSLQIMLQITEHMDQIDGFYYFQRVFAEGECKLFKKEMKIWSV